MVRIPNHFYTMLPEMLDAESKLLLCRKFLRIQKLRKNIDADVDTVIVIEI